jgi:hypothetical protein
MRFGSRDLKVVRVSGIGSRLRRARQSNDGWIFSGDRPQARRDPRGWRSGEGPVDRTRAPSVDRSEEGARDPIADHSMTIVVVDVARAPLLSRTWTVASNGPSQVLDGIG